MHYDEWLRRKDANDKAGRAAFDAACGSERALIDQGGARSVRISDATKVSIYGESIAVYAAFDRTDLGKGAAYITGFEYLRVEDLEKLVQIKRAHEDWIAGRIADLPEFK